MSGEKIHDNVYLVGGGEISHPADCLVYLIDGGRWEDDTQYFTFVPDFVPEGIWKLLRPVETWLERSRWSVYSAHFMAVWKKNDPC